MKLLGISTSVLRRHRVGDQLPGFRLTLNLAKGKRPFKFFIDGFMVRQDRALAEFSYMNAFQPAATGTEYTLAEAIAQRGALGYTPRGNLRRSSERERLRTRATSGSDPVVDAASARPWSARGQKRGGRWAAEVNRRSGVHSS